MVALSPVSKQIAKGIKMKVKTLGPAGGVGGLTISDCVIPAGSRITKIRISAGDFIDSIQLFYSDSNGKSHALDKIGGAGGDLHEFRLAPDEYITGISGQHGWYVDSITIHTNKRVSESFGGHYGHEPYSFQVSDGNCVTGFFGRADRYIDAIGIIATPCKQKAPSTTSDHKSLLKIAGLGPKAAAVLVDEGIHNVEALAKSSVEQLEAIFIKAGGRLANTKVASWPEQAMHAAREDWKALKAFQASLKKKK